MSLQSPCTRSWDGARKCFTSTSQSGVAPAMHRDCFRKRDTEAERARGHGTARAVGKRTGNVGRLAKSAGVLGTRTSTRGPERSDKKKPNRERSGFQYWWPTGPSSIQEHYQVRRWPPDSNLGGSGIPGAVQTEPCDTAWERAKGGVSVPDVRAGNQPGQLSKREIDLTCQVCVPLLSRVSDCRVHPRDV